MPVSPAVAETTDALLVALLGALDRVEWAQRQLFPPRALELADRLAPHAERLAGPLRALEAAAWPEDLRLLRERLGQVTRQAIELIGAFASAAHSGEPIELYRALRRFAPLQEALYPLAPVLDPVSRWFLEPGRRGNDLLVQRLRDAALREDGARVGVLHARNDHGSRGGLSLYVPETWEASAPPAPLVVALHGGSGHGRDFLWAWLREARSRGVLLLSPTALDRTWSIMGGEDVDADNLRATVESVAERYGVDRTRVLLTGMSDGATYTLLCGLGDTMPFTHLAPMCGVLHPYLLAGGIAGARDRPIYLVHGALDWMFPLPTAHLARETLLAVGARLVYREIEDLSHTYPRDENPRVLDWLMAKA
jgi:phospholipase/carboxylesterase